MSYDTIIVQRDGPVAVFTLNRPDRRNSVSRQMCKELTEALQQAIDDDGISVVVLTASGDKAFCSGSDLNEAREAQESGDTTFNQQVSSLHSMVEGFPKPLIAAVNGAAFGGGALFAINSDIRIAAESSSFGFVGAKLGMITGSGKLPAIIGASRAKELIFTARPVEAKEALAIGLVNQVVPYEHLQEAALEMAKAIAVNSLPALRYAKEVINMATIEERAMSHERDAGRRLAESAEGRQRLQQGMSKVIGERKS